MDTCAYSDREWLTSSHPLEASPTALLLAFDILQIGTDSRTSKLIPHVSYRDSRNAEPRFISENDAHHLSLCAYRCSSAAIYTVVPAAAVTHSSAHCRLPWATPPCTPPFPAGISLFFLIGRAGPLFENYGQRCPASVLRSSGQRSAARLACEGTSANDSDICSADMTACVFVATAGTELVALGKFCGVRWVAGWKRERMMEREGGKKLSQTLNPKSSSNSRPAPNMAISHNMIRNGTTVAERQTRANRVQSPAGSPDFRKWESCRTMPLVGGFSRVSPVSPLLHSGAAPYSLHSPSSTQDLAVKSRLNLFIHSLVQKPVCPAAPKSVSTDIWRAWRLWYTARKVRRRQQRQDIMSTRLLMWQTLAAHNRRLQRQRHVEHLTWRDEWTVIVFAESRFCLQHHYGRIRVWWYRGTRLGES
ncbi:hypothetical protein PR048_004424 [Dryococelus australis]|uniref:Uncharacterized protein n=1 Tax=Dryococelus australis TaxID=614101 RepID=A0ABQ9I5F1_9NEOP|nr:hypothetical protein PR048_004424 [Dryococelus australis]